ncbi:hypothetical protein BUE80_DR002804 [Diplocarpon rosae]|nr:hypothetical protein BUE80_DR002804 [Diplocarpon rosae]
MRVLLGNSRSEVERPATPASVSKENAPLKAEHDDDDEDFGDWSFSPEDEGYLARRRAQTGLGSPSLHTPCKAIKTTEFATPRSKRKLDEHMLPTPSTGGRTLASYDTGRKDEDIFTTPSSRLNTRIWDADERSKLLSPSATPTPARHREQIAVSESQEFQGTRMAQNYDISDEVLELLKDQHINDGTAANLKALLSKHAMKICGIAKGRDITRVSLRAKDRKIAELQQKISALEAQRELDRTVIRHFKSDMTGSIERRRARGRSRGRGSG